MVSSVTTFGIFVTLDAMYVEGLVHITELGGDYFRFDETRQELRGERSGIRYGIGTRVRVQVSRVDLDGRRIDFRLIRDGEDGLVQPSRGARSAGKDDNRSRRDGRDTRSESAHSDKWSRRDAKANRAQRNSAAAAPVASNSQPNGKQSRKAAKKAMLKEVNLAALEAEYAAKLAPTKQVAPVVDQEPASAAPAAPAKPSKTASKKKVPALLKADASVPVSVPAAKKPAQKTAPKSVKAAKPAAKTSKRKTAP